MKRLLLCMLLACVLISSCFISPTNKAFASSISDNSVIILTGKVNQEKQLVIQANLTVNTGTNAMTLELSYNKNAMVLSNLVFGTALSSLDPITSNTETEAGYGITPFKINYWSNDKENDYTTGELFTLTFTLANNVKDGNYTVALKYGRNKDLIYYDNNGEVRTKNILIDNAEVSIKNNSIVDVNIISGNSKLSMLAIALISILATAMVAGGVFVAGYFFKKRRNWIRYE